MSLISFIAYINEFFNILTPTLKPPRLTKFNKISNLPVYFDPRPVNGGFDRRWMHFHIQCSEIWKSAEIQKCCFKKAKYKRNKYRIYIIYIIFTIFCGNPFTLILAVWRWCVFNRMTLAKLISQYLWSSEKCSIKIVRITAKKWGVIQ